jgi:hypothetical protein
LEQFVGLGATSISHGGAEAQRGNEH